MRFDMNCFVIENTTTQQNQRTCMVEVYLVTYYLSSNVLLIVYFISVSPSQAAEVMSSVSDALGDDKKSN